MSEAAKLAELVSQVRLGHGASKETPRTRMKLAAPQPVRLLQTVSTRAPSSERTSASA